MFRPSTALLALACGLTAATIPEMELAQVVERSPRIIQGRIVRTWAAWDAAHKAIWTHAEVAVTRDLRGNAGPAVVISELGGVVDGMEMHAPGAPTLEVGEDLVAFTYQTPGGLWRLRGWGQGKYRIERDDAGREIVRRDGYGAALVKLGGGPAAVAHSAGAHGALEGDREPLESFLGRVEALLAAEERQ